MAKSATSIDMAIENLLGRQCLEPDAQKELIAKKDNPEPLSPGMEVLMGINLVAEKLREKQHTDKEIQLYLNGEEDELEYLSPIEVLQGKVFPGQAAPHEYQARLLGLSFDNRLEKVINVASRPNPWETIG